MISAVVVVIALGTMTNQLNFIIIWVNDAHIYIIIIYVRVQNEWGRLFKSSPKWMAQQERASQPTNEESLDGESSAVALSALQPPGCVVVIATPAASSIHKINGRDNVAYENN